MVIDDNEYGTKENKKIKLKHKIHVYISVLP